ncbi:ribosome maturation factor RimM [Candidatus Coxiella mudrowiae]|uniref:Ribosome maturation factor RimM n=1 Tax=Candidatus Coxiella mudrowiae TaxID=2054173 RepID=A0ABN4HRB7_9COXI|nr:ribosome maturation factor RimM [Candidatus Coxiella mudrowiae]AKQ33829.1 Ribosome maturation factor RimM [Candidatus Coxiella mudrowiae]
MQNKKVIMGRLARAYGVQGWIKIVSFTDPIKNLLTYKNWFIRHHNEWQLFSLRTGRIHGPFLVVKLEGLDDPETAKQYTNDLIAVERNTLTPLEENEYYWTDLIGMRIITTEGVALGTVKSLLETGSNDVLITSNQGHGRLIPYLSHVVKSVDIENKIIMVNWNADF